MYKDMRVSKRSQYSELSQKFIVSKNLTYRERSLTVAARILMGTDNEGSGVF
jgi:hypothetical protein